MKVLGIALAKNQLRLSLLNGTRKDPVLVCKERINTIDPLDIPPLMDWYETNFDDLINRHAPDKIAYKLSLEQKKDQLGYLAFPLGILNLIAKKKGVPIVQYSSRGIGPAKLGLPKETNIYQACDEKFGTNPPHWDNSQKDSVLVAWFEL